MSSHSSWSRWSYLFIWPSQSDARYYQGFRVGARWEAGTWILLRGERKSQC